MKTRLFGLTTIFLMVYYANWRDSCSTHFIIEEEFSSLQQFQPLSGLISRPLVYHKKPVSIAGVLSWDGNEQAVYVARDFFVYGVCENAIWLHNNLPPQVSAQEMKAMNGAWVRISGEYDAHALGNKGLYSGTLIIATIKRANPIPEREGK